jgi:predicted enzyme related to lactoylglutathione lyase
MPRPIHFEIQAADPERAIQFYRSLFDWQFNQWGDQKYWLIGTGDKSQPGIDGGLLPRPTPAAPENMAAVNCFVCTIDVPNLDVYVDKALKNGGTIALPKMPIPTVGWLAYCKDTEGNIFGMMQMDPNAK